MGTGHNIQAQYSNTILGNTNDIPALTCSLYGISWGRAAPVSNGWWNEEGRKKTHQAKCLALLLASPASSVRPDTTTLSCNPQRYTKRSHRLAICIGQQSVDKKELDDWKRGEGRRLI